MNFIADQYMTGITKTGLQSAHTVRYWTTGMKVNRSRMLITVVLMRDGSDGWLFVDAETSYPIDHCPKCGRRLDKNAKYVIVPLAYDEEGK